MKTKNSFDVYQIVVENIIIVLTDMTKILEIIKVKDLEETIKHMTIALPNMRNIPATTNLEALQKTIKYMANTIPSLTQTHATETEDTLQKLVKNMIDTTTSMINTCAIRNGEILQRVMENTETIILKTTEIFTEIEWDNFEPADADMEKAHKILSNENIEQMIFEKLNGQPGIKKNDNSFKIILLVFMLLYHTMMFISDAATITVKECVNNRINPIVETVKHAYQKKKIKTENEAINQVSQELMQNVPSEITDFFMIVTKNNLSVHKEKELHSEIIGTVHFMEVVQFIERKENWAYISHNNPEDNGILEGWVLTKHLKIIK